MENHPKGQICSVLTVGWPMLSGFVVEGWKSDLCDSSRVKIGLFQKKTMPETWWSRSAAFESEIITGQRPNRALARPLEDSALQAWCQPTHNWRLWVWARQKILKEQCDSKKGWKQHILVSFTFLVPEPGEAFCEVVSLQI